MSECFGSIYSYEVYIQCLSVWFYLQLRGVQSESECLGSIYSYEAYCQSLSVLVLFAAPRRTD